MLRTIQFRIFVSSRLLDKNVKIKFAKLVICTETMSVSFCSNIYIYIYPTRCNVTQFILSGNCSTCFGWYHYSSSGAQTTVSTASGICHTVTATCRYRERVGTGLSVLWVAYATQSTLRTVPTLPR